MRKGLRGLAVKFYVVDEGNFDFVANNELDFLPRDVSQLSDFIASEKGVPRSAVRQQRGRGLLASFMRGGLPGNDHHV